jgi:hypothetical protein
MLYKDQRVSLTHILRLAFFSARLSSRRSGTATAIIAQLFAKRVKRRLVQKFQAFFHMPPDEP